MRPTETRSAAPRWIDESSGKAMAHPLRVKILGELSQRIMSVKQFADVFPKYSYSQIYGHFRKLRELGFIELVEIKSGGRRRSAKEQFYRATERAFFDQTAWAALPASIRRGATAETLSNYIARVSEAIKIDTMDARPDRHVSWTDGHYDEQAWDETIRDLKEFLERIPRRQAEASTRLAESGEEPIRVTIGLSCFESPKASATDA